MNFKYEILVRVSFRHSYFLNETPTCFSVAPTADTERFLLDNAMLFKHKSDGFLLAFESYNNGKERSREAALSSDKVLKFVVNLRDPLFFNYSSVDSADISNSLFHFRNFQGGKDGLLHAGEHVGLTDIVPVENIGEFFFTKPFAVVEIQLNNIQAEEYFIRFQEKSTYWRYLLVSDHLKNLNEPAILNGPVVFKGPVEIKLPNNKMALAFESGIPIGIKQRSEKIFQLVENYDTLSNKGKTVIKALPQPDVNIISKINNDAQKEYSEIII